MNQLYEAVNLIIAGVLGVISLVLFNKKNIPFLAFLSASFVGGACAYYGTPVVFALLELEENYNSRLAGAVGFFIGVCSQGIILRLTSIFEKEHIPNLIKAFIRRLK